MTLQQIETRISKLEGKRRQIDFKSPADFAEKTLGFKPDLWQSQALEYSGKRLILNCSRQSGKSTVAAIKGLHRAVFYPASLVLLISASFRQSQELFRKVSDFSDSVDMEKTEDNRLSATLSNGSRIISLPSKESTIRGFSGADLIIEDEAARVPDDLYYALRPMLATSDGALILMSTPFGKRGHFFHEWTSGDSWEKISVPATECERISAEFLSEELQSLGEYWWRQEYGTEFMETVDSVFSYEMIQNAFTDEVTPLFEDAECETKNPAFI